MNIRVVISAALFLTVCMILLADYCECKKEKKGKWEFAVKDKNRETVGKCKGYFSPPSVKKCCCSKQDSKACTLDYAIESATQGMKYILKEHGPGGKWEKC